MEEAAGGKLNAISYLESDEDAYLASEVTFDGGFLSLSKTAV